jgi:hypothetical protein
VCEGFQKQTAPKIAPSALLGINHLALISLIVSLFYWLNRLSLKICFCSSLEFEIEGNGRVVFFLFFFVVFVVVVIAARPCSVPSMSEAL